MSEGACIDLSDNNDIYLEEGSLPKTATHRCSRFSVTVPKPVYSLDHRITAINKDITAITTTTIGNYNGRSPITKTVSNNTKPIYLSNLNRQLKDRKKPHHDHFRIITRKVTCQQIAHQTTRKSGTPIDHSTTMIDTFSRFEPRSHFRKNLPKQFFLTD